MLTIGKVAERFARVEPNLPASYFAGQLRHYVRLGLVRPPLHRGAARTSAALFGEHEICAAYLLSALSRLGLRAEQLRATVRYFDAVTTRGRPRGEEFGGLAQVIRDTEDGRRWFLVVKVWALNRGEGPAGHALRGEFHERPDAHADDAGDWLAAVTLDCELLLRPLLEVLRRPDGPARGGGVGLAS